VLGEERFPPCSSFDEKAFDWLKHFDFHSRKAQVGAHRLLILRVPTVRRFS